MSMSADILTKSARSGTRPAYVVAAVHITSQGGICLLFIGKRKLSTGLLHPKELKVEAKSTSVTKILLEPHGYEVYRWK